MTEYSLPWGGEITGDAGPYTDDMWSDMYRDMFQIDRTVESVIRGAENNLEVLGVSSPVSIDTGCAIVDGKYYKSDTSVDIVIPTPAVSTRIDRIVLRKTWATQLVRLHRIAGVEGGGVPALTQVDGTTWDVPLAQVSIVITTGLITITDERVYTTTPFVQPLYKASGRLTLSSNVPVTTSDVLAATTVYYTHYNGNIVDLYDGASVWKSYLFEEISLDISAFVADTNYDVFIYNNIGTITLEALAWTNDTTRATALIRQDGVLCKTGALTRRYLGTIRITGTTGQCEDSLLNRFVYNFYNQITRTASYSNTVVHTNAGSDQVWNGVTAGASFILGLTRDVTIQLATEFISSAGGGTARVYIKVDTVADPSIVVDHRANVFIKNGNTGTKIIDEGKHTVYIWEGCAGSVSYRQAFVFVTLRM